MFEADLKSAIYRTAQIAFTQFDFLSDPDKEAILKTIIESNDGPEAERAQASLYHRRAAAAQQLQLKALIEGIARGQARP